MRGNFGPTGAALAVFTATYDAAGNRLSSWELDGSRVTYGYDPSDQLVSEQRSGSSVYLTTYQYDPAGNRTIKGDDVLAYNSGVSYNSGYDYNGGITTYLYNAADEMALITPTGAPPTTLSYDPNGNLSAENAGGALTSYAWDPENRLTGVAYPDGTRETYLYSADGMRQKSDSNI